MENERGLFKIVALYVTDKVNGRGGKSMREYFDAPESRRFETGLNVATVLADFAVLGPMWAILGLPTLAVGLALVGAQWGFQELTDPAHGVRGDSRN